MYLLNGKKITGAFTDSRGFQYPENWLALATPKERTAAGIVTVADPVYPDPLAYTYTEDAAGNVTPVARPIATVRKEHKDRLREQGNTVLLANWNVLEIIYISRIGTAGQKTALDNSLAAVVNAYNNAASAVDAAQTVDAVIAVTATWPTL